MPLGDCLYRGRSGAQAALLVGNVDAAIAALSPQSEVVAMLREGRVADALTCLERADDPKWSSSESCRAAYQKAMNGKAKPHMEKPL
ncbi:hypothetical protein [Methylorubrum populi]